MFAQEIRSCALEWGRGCLRLSRARRSRANQGIYQEFALVCAGCNNGGEDYGALLPSIGRPGGKYACLEVYPEHLATRRTVKPELVMGIVILGKVIGLDHGYGSEANPELKDFVTAWYRTLQSCLMMVRSNRIQSRFYRVGSKASSLDWRF